MIKIIITLFVITAVSGNAIAQVNTMNLKKTDSADIAANTDFSTYTVTVSESKSRCQVLINDIALMYYEGMGPRSFYANGAILNSGIQSIKIVSEGEIPVVTINETKNIPGAYRDKVIWKNEGTLQGNFQATVPYDIVGWSNSKNIAEDNAAKADALKWFVQTEKLLKDGKGAEFMKELLPVEKMAATLYNLKDEETKKFHANWTNFINAKDYTLVPVSECKIEIVGNGRLAHLVNEFKEGGFALKANNEQLLFLDIYLHLPNSKSNVEPILANFKQITTNYKKLNEGSKK